MIEAFINDFGVWMGAIAAIVLAADKLVKLTPTKADDRVLRWARKILRVLAVDVPDRQHEADK